MSTINNVGSGFAPSRIIAPPKPPVTTADILQQKRQEDAIIAKSKNPEERTLGDYITLADYYLQKLMNVPVTHLDNSNIDYFG